MDTQVYDDEPPPEPREGWLLIRIYVPELNVHKCLQFPSDKVVWDVKQQVLASLPKVSVPFYVISKQQKKMTTILFMTIEHRSVTVVFCAKNANKINIKQIIAMLHFMIITIISKVITIALII